MIENLPTRGQLERQISQKIQAFYRSRLGHQPSKVSCQLFDQKLAIIIEESITQAEQILVQEGKKELAEEVHSHLDDAIQPELKQLVEEIIQVKIIDLLSDATLQTGRTGMIAVLDQTPQVRNPDSIPKVKS
ncbi:hypothetical protein STA3757_20510 [Stanieria sp. NIES-3757]|nr:hypothetical protein STA3757_20510 [Stanieria sp. NIES-3757]